jgi:twitching motility two-component system response regulator PilG
LESFQKSLRGWQFFRDVVASPHQRPYLSSVSTISGQCDNASTATLEKLVKLMRGVSIRQLAAILKQEELKVLQFLSPYIRNGVIYLRSPQPPFDRLPIVPKLEVVNTKPAESKRWKVVCIDDSPTILDGMKRFLGDGPFEISAIDNPSKSISTLFQLKPDLILMDITMPGINGYQLCSLLRKSDPHFETIPIIMVTGNRGIIDRAKAKLSGATDYLTKPFTREELLDTVNKHLNISVNAKVTMSSFSG